jgi:hydroxymethylpyrimidine kinase/phosphomethylpyrimidine kinase
MGAPVITALTIAGVDSGGGAGIAADLKAFREHDVWGTCAITAVTAQNPRGVHGIELVSPEMVAAQIEAVVDGFPVAAAKTGMVPNAAAVDAVLRALPPSVPLVVDPVMVATSGDRLADDAVGGLLRRAVVVTPNAEEATALTGVADMAEAAGLLLRMGAQVAMVTGGASARDCLASATGIQWLDGTPVDAPSNHGTGCVLSAAITAEIAKGMDPVDACIAAKHFVAQQLATGWPFFV